MRIYSLAFILCVGLTCSAFARSGAYLAIRGGLSDLRETEVLDVNEASAVPYQPSTELVQDALENDILTTEFHRVMANGYLDLRVTRNVLPYLTAGAGIARHNIEVLEEKISGSNFAWSVGAGVGLRLTRNVTADAGIRYIDLGKVEINDGQKELAFDTVETYAGLRFMF